MAKYLSFLLVLLAVCSVQSFLFKRKQCPSISPASNLEIEKLLGKWYVILKSDTSDRCITYDIKKISSLIPHYRINKRYKTKTLGIKYWRNSDVEFSNKHPSTPNLFTTKKTFWGTESTISVFMTDNSSYAAIFTCTKKTFKTTYGVTVLSKHETLDSSIVREIRNYMGKHGLKDDLAIVSHKDC